MKTYRILCCLLLLCGFKTALADVFNHGLWDQLLKAHVVSLDHGQSSMVDYQGFAQDKAPLKQYLQSLSDVKPDVFNHWSKDEQLAFLINAYNAWTVDLILSAWPKLDSIKDLGSLFSSPWRKSFIPLLGEMRSLDDIEHQLIRGSQRYKEPRIHFAVNCASVGCPALRLEAYNAVQLETQLEEQARLFLSDRSRNRYEDGELKLSAIFKWYREDFEKGWQGYTSLAAFLAHYSDALALPDDAKQQLSRDDLDIEFLDYDWRLNAKR